MARSSRGGLELASEGLQMDRDKVTSPPILQSPWMPLVRSHECDAVKGDSRGVPVTKNSFFSPDGGLLVRNGHGLLSLWLINELTSDVTFMTVPDAEQQQQNVSVCSRSEG